MHTKCKSPHTDLRISLYCSEQENMVLGRELHIWRYIVLGFSTIQSIKIWIIENNSKTMDNIYSFWDQYLFQTFKRMPEERQNCWSGLGRFGCNSCYLVPSHCIYSPAGGEIGRVWRACWTVKWLMICEPHSIDMQISYENQKELQNSLSAGRECLMMLTLYPVSV